MKNTNQSAIGNPNLGQQEMDDLTTAQLLWISEKSREGRLDRLWDQFDLEASGIIPPLPAGSSTFAARREYFFLALETLIQMGYIRLTLQGVSERTPLRGKAEEQVAELRNNFPHQSEELELKDGQSWFDTADCRFGVEWHWPGRTPFPMFPGHNPRYTYIEPGWNGQIDPDWERWRFTPGRLSLDDFETAEAAREYMSSRPNYYQVTPRIERIK